MKSFDIVRLQALKLKATVNHRFLIEAAMKEPDDSESLKKDFRNVCSLLHVVQFDQLTELCTLLDLTKREVISMALADFIRKANSVVEEINPFEAASGPLFEAAEEGK